MLHEGKGGAGIYPGVLGDIAMMALNKLARFTASNGGHEYLLHEDGMNDNSN